MITEDYCSFEVAKLLKEKGFDEPVYRGISINNLIFTKEKPEDFNYELSAYCSQPTHQMAMKWLREEKNIIVNVWYNGVDWSAEYYNNEDENFYLITDYSCNSYEDAVEVALKYCLENLI